MIPAMNAQSYMAAVGNSPAVIARFPSNVTSFAAPVSQSMQTKQTITDVGLVGANMLAGASAVGGSAVSMVGATIHRKRDKKALLEEMRPIIARDLGMTSEQVTMDTLDFYASLPQGEGVKMAIDSIDSKRNHTFGSGVAASAVGAACVAAGPAGWAGLALGIPASWVTSKAYDALFGAEKPTINDQLKLMEEKLSVGEGVSAMDVFHLHILRDPQLQTCLEASGYSKLFESSNDAQKAEVLLTQYPGIAQRCELQAAQLNAHQKLPAELLSEPTSGLACGIPGDAPIASIPSPILNTNTIDYQGLAQTPHNLMARA